MFSLFILAEQKLTVKNCGAVRTEDPKQQQSFNSVAIVETKDKLSNSAPSRKNEE